jgi:hypothetical protein
VAFLKPWTANRTRIAVNVRHALDGADAGTLCKSRYDCDLFVGVEYVCHRDNVLQQYVGVNSFCDTFFGVRNRSWIVGVALTIATVVLVAGEQHRAREKYETERQEACVRLSLTPEEKHACEKEAQNRKDYAPWWNVLIAWPEGMGLWAVITTGFVIAWQSSETRRAGTAALNQADLMKKTIALQFRPQIVVRCGAVHPSAEAKFGELPVGSMEFTVANTGGSIAHILTCEVEVMAFVTPPRMLFCHSSQSRRFTLAAGQSTPKWVDIRGEVNEAIRWLDTVGAGTIGRSNSKNIYFAGVIWYEDESEIRRSMGFFRKYDPDTKRFVASGDPDREYAD